VLGFSLMPPGTDRKPTYPLQGHIHFVHTDPNMVKVAELRTA